MSGLWSGDRVNVSPAFLLVADYAKDGRLTEPSDGKRYEWREMIDAVKALGRPLTDEEADQCRAK